jgi:hypothetical protein
MYKTIVLFIFLLTLSYTQVVYEPLRSSVYSFLANISQKGIMEFNDQIKPLSRIYIAEKLIEIENIKEKLTRLEQKEYEFYCQDFAFEINQINLNTPLHPPLVRGKLKGEQKKSIHPPESSLSKGGEEKESVKLLNNFQPSMIDSFPREKNLTYCGRDKYKRYRLFSYTDSLFHLNVSPVIGGVFGSQDGKSFKRQWNGIYFYGSMGRYIGFSFDLINAGETGENIDRRRQFSADHGIIPKGTDKPDQIDFNEINVMQTTSWNWGSFSIGKNILKWGYGNSGDIVLSTKAPSYPQIRLDLKLTSWFNFNYVHAWLNSDVVDSSAIYATDIPGSNRIIYRNKYFATHTFSFIPKKGLNVSLGESIVYADRLQFSYLQPFMFFRAADHYLSKQNNNAGENSQFFFSVNSRNHIRNTQLFAILFLDEIRMRIMFSDKNRNQIGYQFGGSVVDLPIKNLKIAGEYTRIYPYVYRHYIPTQTYESSSYLLGHWIGHNADLLFGSITYRILRGLSVELWGQYFRKGEDGSLDEQYSSTQPTFLFGLNANRSWVGLDIKYEIVHELFVRAQVEFYQESIEQGNGTFIETNKRNIYFSVYYGM